MTVTGLQDVDKYFLQFVTINVINCLFTLNKQTFNLIKNSEYYDGLIDIKNVYKNGQVHVINLLFNNDKYSENWFNLYDALDCGNIQVVQYLHKNCIDIYTNNNCPVKAVKVVSSKSSLKFCKLLKKNYVNIKKRNNISLIEASLNGDLEAVKHLHKNGANIDAQDNFAIILASENGHLEIVKYLHINGANIQAQCNLAIVRASQYGHLTVVEYLHKNGSYIQAQGLSAIILASENGHIEVVKYLHDNSTYTKKDYKRLLKLVLKCGHKNVIEYLYKSSNIPVQYTLEAEPILYGGYIEHVEYLHRNVKMFREHLNWNF